MEVFDWRSEVLSALQTSKPAASLIYGSADLVRNCLCSVQNRKVVVAILTAKKMTNFQSTVTLLFLKFRLWLPPLPCRS